MQPAPNPALYEFDPTTRLSDVLVQLAEMPAALRAAVRGVQPVDLARRPSGDEWSAFETICHVRDAALVYSARFRWMVFDDNPFMPNYDENNWVAASLDTPDDLPAILDEIAASRSDLMRVLLRLPEESWLRTGHHELAGTIVLDHYVRHQAVHETLHLEQLRLALSRQ